MHYVITQETSKRVYAIRRNGLLIHQYEMDGFNHRRTVRDMVEYVLARIDDGDTLTLSVSLSVQD